MACCSMQRAQVGQKRGRAELEALDVGPDGAPRKKARAGFVAQQWITIYNKHQPMKQRCARPPARRRACGTQGFNARKGTQGPGSQLACLRSTRGVGGRRCWSGAPVAPTWPGLLPYVQF